MLFLFSCSNYNNKLDSNINESDSSTNIFDDELNQYGATHEVEETEINDVISDNERIIIPAKFYYFSYSETPGVEELLNNNIIDKLYIEECNDAMTTMEFMDINNKYLDIWKNELDNVVDKIKVRITLSKDYRMVCKQNGFVADGSVGVFGAWTIGRNYALCNAIDFSKDLATGEIYRYQCEKFDDKYVNLKSAQNARGDIKVRFDKNEYEDRKRTLKKLSDMFVSIEIPPCFVEE